ncbi:MAG: ABC transporter permease [Fulvivirga sp.]|uniref:ABC transporter permease n=1 Tax=Fulvivirga sp. TaxID=1931237 RepID=UPI0032F072FE
MFLTNEHINYIAKDIQYRGIVDEDLGEELLDHICTLVEEKMQSGIRFIEAYDEIIKEFGNEEKLVSLQSQTIQYSNNNTKIMIRNYFKIAFRNLVKHKFYSAINIIGLAVGVACSLLIYLFVQNELNYDDFHVNGNNIYRIERYGKINGNEFKYPTAPAPFGFTAVEEIPEVEQVVRFRNRGTYLVKTPESNESIKEDHLIFADSTLFDLFTFKVIEGDKTTALVRPYTVAINKSTANKYYPGESALNKTLIMDGNESFEITAVFEDIPSNSHIQFDFFMSMSTIQNEAGNNMWLSNNFYTYIRAAEGVESNGLALKLSDFYGRKVEPQLKEFLGVGIEEFAASGNEVILELKQLEDIYLKSDFIFDIGKTGNQQSVYLFIAIAIFILALACINFMNLSTARSANRAKEVGVRKALGSYKSHLVRQFLTESIIMSLMAVIVGFILVIILLPFFNLIAERSLTIPFGDPHFILSVLGGAIVIGVIAGIYPAFFLSSF